MIDLSRIQPMKQARREGRYFDSDSRDSCMTAKREREGGERGARIEQSDDNTKLVGKID